MLLPYKLSLILNFYLTDILSRTIRENLSKVLEKNIEVSKVLK